jgi:hypothetical protein
MRQRRIETHRLLTFDDIVGLGLWRRQRVERCVTTTKLEADDPE